MEEVGEEPITTSLSSVEDYPRQMKEYIMKHIEEVSRQISLHRRYFGLRNLVTFTLSHIEDPETKGQLTKELQEIKHQQLDFGELYQSQFGRVPVGIIMDSMFASLLPDLENLWIRVQDELVAQGDITMDVMGPGDLLRAKVLRKWQMQELEEEIHVEVPDDERTEE